MPVQSSVQGLRTRRISAGGGRIHGDSSAVMPRFGVDALRQNANCFEGIYGFLIRYVCSFGLSGLACDHWRDGDAGEAPDTSHAFCVS